MQTGRLRRLAELGDVGAGDKGAAGAGQHDRLHFRIGDSALDVLRAFHPNDGLLGNQEIAARTNLPKPTVSRLTYTLTKLGYLTPVPRFEKYQLAPSAMALGYAALANLGVRHLSEPFREEVMRETGGAVAVGGRDRHSMIYFGQSRNGLTLGVQLDVGSRIPIANTAMGRA